MLAALFLPQRTTAGNVARSGDVARYSEDDLTLFCARYLGQSVSPKALVSVRKGNIPSANVGVLLRRCLDRFEAGLDVELLVRRDRFRQQGWTAIRFFERFGFAPNGNPSIVDFLEKLAVRLVGVDVAVLDEAAALEGRRRETGSQELLRGDYPELRERLERFGGELPVELRPYVLEDGRFTFGEDAQGSEIARRVLRAAFEARLCRFES